MIKAGQIDKGTALLIKGQPFVCIEREFVNPGKGSAFVRLKLKSPATGQVLSETMKSQDNAEDITVEDIDYQYMYKDQENYVLMSTTTFEQTEVPISSFPDHQYFMKEGDTYRCAVYNEEILNIILPTKMVYIIEECEDAVKGDTVQGTTKYAKTDCGLEIKVPIFIKKGEKVRVNTETKEYLERVND